MKALVVFFAALFFSSVPLFAQEKTKKESGKMETKDTDKKEVGKSAEPYKDSRKSLGSRPAGPICKDSLLRDIDRRDDIEGTMKNNNDELPQRMNCNSINDISPRQESLENPLYENSPVMKDPE